MTPPASRPTALAAPAAGTPAGQVSITIREGASPYGPDISLPQAIQRLRDGEQVTVVPAGTSAADGDPRGEPVSGFDVTVYPARTSPYRDEPPKVNWGRKGAVPAADAALAAETLTLASRLAMYAGLGEAAPATPDQASAARSQFREALRLPRPGHLSRPRRHRRHHRSPRDRPAARPQKGKP